MSLVMHEFIRSRDQVVVKKKSFAMQAWCGVQLKFIEDSHAQ